MRNSGNFTNELLQFFSSISSENMEIIILFLLFFTHVFAFSKANLLLQKVLEDIQPHWEVYILSDTEIVDVVQNVEIISKFLYSSSNTTELHLNPNAGSVDDSIRHIFQRSLADVAIIVCMSIEETTFTTVEKIGAVFNSLRELRRVWTVVIWPSVMSSHKEIKALRDKEIYQNSIKNFVVNSRLYFTFNLSSDVITYEAYRAGEFYAFSWLEHGVIQWNCKFCEGFSMRRFNFHQRILRVTAVNDTEINDDIHVYLDSNGTVTYSKTGFSGALLVILQQMLNFTIEPTLSNEFGRLIPGTNKWTGSVGDIAEGKFDLAISITILRPDRASMVSFLPPVDEHQIHAFFKPPGQNAIRDIFAQPFKPSLWAAVIVTWIVLALCMIMFSLIRKRYGMDMDGLNDEGYEEDEDKEEPDFTQDSFIWALGTACQQGWDDHPRAGSLRAIFISGSFTGVVAYAGYSAAIVSTLSLRVDPIQTPLQLLDSNLRVGIRDGFISTLLEQNGTHDTMSRFYAKVKHAHKREQYLNVSSGFEHLLKHPYAFITTRDTMYDLLKMTRDEKAICEVKDLSILRYGFPLGYPVPKFSPFREILRYAMTMMREPGVLNRLKHKYAFKRRCKEGNDNAGYALGANDVFTAFMVLCGGIVLSVVFLVVERMVSFKKFAYLR